MIECSQTTKILSHASNFAHYVVNCNVMTQKVTETPHQKEKLVWLVDHIQQNTHTKIWE
jgi:hypothetical protein